MSFTSSNEVDHVTHDTIFNFYSLSISLLRLKNISLQNKFLPGDIFSLVTRNIIYHLYPSWLSISLLRCSTVVGSSDIVHMDGHSKHTRMRDILRKGFRLPNKRSATFLAVSNSRVRRRRQLAYIRRVKSSGQLFVQLSTVRQAGAAQISFLRIHRYHPNASREFHTSKSRIPTPIYLPEENLVVKSILSLLYVKNSLIL